MIALLSFILIPPFFSDNVAGGMILPVLMSAILLLGLNVFRQSRWEFLVALAFGLPALAGRWLMEFADVGELPVFVSVCWIGFLAFMVFIILRSVLTTRRVTYDTISGAICGYLLFGVMYAFAFVIISYFYPGSFGASLGLSLARGHMHIKHQFEHYIYFSFVTLASLGYGDVVPLSPPARAFAAIEGIAGQFYIAVLLARLVSLHSSRWGSE